MNENTQLKPLVPKYKPGDGVWIVKQVWWNQPSHNVSFGTIDSIVFWGSDNPVFCYQIGSFAAQEGMAFDNFEDACKHAAKCVVDFTPVESGYKKQDAMPANRNRRWWQFWCD